MAGPQAKEKPSQALAVLERIPFFTSKIIEINEATIAASDLIQRVGPAVPDALQALPVIGMALKSLDFVRVPLIYLTCYSLDEKIPFTLDNNAKMAFGGVVLALGVSAILVPVAAPFLMLGSALTMLSSSAFTWRSLVNKSREDKEAIATLQNQIKDLTDGDEKANLNKELGERQKSQDALAFVDKGVGFGLGSLMVTGAVLSVLAVSSVAPFIFIAAGLGAGAYLVGRLAAPPLTRLAHWMMGAPKVDDSTLTNDTTTLQQKGPEICSQNDRAAEVTKAPIQTVVAVDQSKKLEEERLALLTQCKSYINLVQQERKENSDENYNKAWDDPVGISSKSAKDRELEAKQIEKLLSSRNFSDTTLGQVKKKIEGLEDWSLQKSYKDQMNSFRASAESRAKKKPVAEEELVTGQGLKY